MSDSRRPSARMWNRRRANIDGPSVHVKVSMSEAERAQLLVLEQRTGRSASELLVSAALSGEAGDSVAERRALLTELMGARRVLANVANNVNQLARVANLSANGADLSGVEFPEDFREQSRRFLAEARQVGATIFEIVERLR